MQGVVVALPNDEELAGELGKKGTTNSIFFFNKKIRGIAITVLFPSNVEEKFYAVAQSILLSNVVVLSSKNINVLFGESLIACSLLGKKVLITSDNDTSNLVRGLGIEYKVVEKERLEEEILSSAPSAEKDSETRIDLDHAFPVTGVGDVVLGIVTKGSVAKHASLFHNSGKQVTVRSIQMQDEDVESAEKGARVGLALKGISYKDVEKGDVLASRQIKPRQKIVCSISFSSLAKEIPSFPFRCFFVHNFSYANCTVNKQGESFEINFEKGIPIENGDSFLLVRSELPRIFAKGTVIG